ncbi:MAG: 3-methyl-2-oxobutanoate dehydrogenase subunit VorB [Bacteroidetes bacterium]|uniref:3-methyl-2-oxobutanoate dehydrogenase subunit VorB n=1 Tax=Candidatus Cryptobacteroides intestinavium TaxID=2840766 RepID=A0A9D9HI72_9BACT|nr:3-methyl-2-oxobutanoate dehydrogenase subunit VorB [Candidatus Cryptobacteroides intestinavium]
MAEKILMKGNEAIAISAIRNGVDGYFGYPITPQSEVMETLMKEKPWETTGMVVLQAESETSAVNMIYGGASCGKKVMTSSSSPGVSLMCEGISYMAGAELPCVIVDVMRGGPGLGTIQPSQSDYNMIVKGGGHGDFHNIVIAPASAQDMYDFIDWGFELAFRYRNPVIILADGIIGQMMEKVEIHPVKPRRTAEEILRDAPWATVGKPAGRPRNIITSLSLDSDIQEVFNQKLARKYAEIEKNEIKYTEYLTEDAEYLFVAFGCSSRICEAAVDELRSSGIRAGLLRPVTLYPYPFARIGELAGKVRSIMSIELNLGQMVDDVRLAAGGRCPVGFYGRQGGNIFTPEEIVEEFRKFNNLK